MRLEGASLLVRKRSRVAPAQIKAIIGVAAPFYLSPLLSFGGMVSESLYVLLLVVLLTILETLPLGVIGLIPWVADAIISLPDEHPPEEVDDWVDMVAMVGLLLLYVAVDLTPLWTRTSLWLLSWRGARVKPLFGAVMAVAFIGSLFLPGSFVTLVLAAFINRTVRNMQDHTVECLHEEDQGHVATGRSLNAPRPSVDASQRSPRSLSELGARGAAVTSRGSFCTVGSVTSVLEASRKSALVVPPETNSAPMPSSGLNLDVCPLESTPEEGTDQPKQQQTMLAVPKPKTPSRLARTRAAKPAAALLPGTSLPESPPDMVFQPFVLIPSTKGGMVSEVDSRLIEKNLGKQLPRIPAKIGYPALHRALIVGTAYTCIVASECSYITGHTKRIVDREFISRQRESPMTSMVFLLFMFPMSAVTAVIFWVYIYRLYLQKVDKQMDGEHNLAMREVFLKKRQRLGQVTTPEMIAVMIFAAFMLSFGLNAASKFSIESTLTTYLLVLLVIGVPREMGNPFLADHSLTWPLIMSCVPWDMILLRIGGTELMHLSRISGVSSWIIDKVLMGNFRMMSPFWCQLVLLATTAVLAEVDTSFGFGDRLVPGMLSLADELRQHELYLVLPVVIQAQYVLLMPYTRLSLIFIHQYTDVEYTELLWLSIFVKVVSSVSLIFFSNIINLALPAQTELMTVANATL